jgi:3-hydroxy-9,10-secoandrosta-1,3,5(10)-triene-9,17-dione monooxygenase reductase component
MTQALANSAALNNRDSDTLNNIDPQALRQALGEFPTGVTIVTTVDPQGQPTGMTASSFNSLSLSPALVLWSIDKNTGCFEAFSHCEHFAIHTLTTEQQALSNLFAKRGVDKFSQLTYTEGAAGTPLLEEYCARFECQIEHRYDGGDHVILVGRVLKLAQQTDRAPLVFHRGRYAQIS